MWETKVKPWYKMTELGVIPEDWEVKQLSEISDCLDSYRVPLNEAQRNKMKWNIPYCWANWVVGYVNDYVIDGDIILIAEDWGHFDEYKTRPIAYRMVWKCWVNNHAHILKSKNTTNQNFLFYSLVNKNILNYLNWWTRAKLNKWELYKIQISIPTNQQEQKLIAQALSDTDELINSLDELIEKKEKIKEWTMQELLTWKKRLPWFSWEFFNTTLNYVIDEIADWWTPTTSNSSYFWWKINWVVIEDIKDKIYFTKQTLTKLWLKNCSSNLWKEWTIILSTWATIWEVWIAMTPTATKQWICGIVINKYWFNIFMKYWFKLNKNLLNAKAQWSSIKEIRPSLLKKINIKLPPTIEEQKAIAEVLSDMDNEIENLKIKRDKYKQIKEWMMQELLTWKTRLV